MNSIENIKTKCFTKCYIQKQKKNETLKYTLNKKKRNKLQIIIKKIYVKKNKKKNKQTCAYIIFKHTNIYIYIFFLFLNIKTFYY